MSKPLPPSPIYTLRGHITPIHALHFLECNTYLLSGDADGTVILWNLITKRPKCVWKAHESTILGVGTWPRDSEDYEAADLGAPHVVRDGEIRIITHGRDSALRVWSLRLQEKYSTILPAEQLVSDEWARSGLTSTSDNITTSTTTASSASFAEKSTVVAKIAGEEELRTAPWLLHSLKVSTLNFCGFASTAGPYTTDSSTDSSTTSTSLRQKEESDKGEYSEMILAVPAADDAEVALYHLPSERLIGVIPPPPEGAGRDGKGRGKEKGKGGMVMALRVLVVDPTPREDRDGSGDADAANTPNPTGEGTTPRARGRIIVIVGYESGRTSVFLQTPSPCPHSHSRPGSAPGPRQERTMEEMFSEWEEVYTDTLHTQPILSLDVHPGREYYFTSSADAVVARHSLPLPLSVRLRSETRSDEGEEVGKAGVEEEESKPGMQILKTGHAGQQSLHIRSDGRVFVTAGWDGRGRIYSTGIFSPSQPRQSDRNGQHVHKAGGKRDGKVGKIKNLAVLKHHRQGCYAAAFSPIALPQSPDQTHQYHEKMRSTSEGGNNGVDQPKDQEDQDEVNRTGSRGDTRVNMGREGMVTPTNSPKITPSAARERKVKETHWVALGGKEGGVGLWGIF